jgi:hypothetical protein
MIFEARSTKMTKMPLFVTCVTDILQKYPTNYNICDLSSGHYFSKSLIFYTSMT